MPLHGVSGGATSTETYCALTGGCQLVGCQTACVSLLGWFRVRTAGWFADRLLPVCLLGIGMTCAHTLCTTLLCHCTIPATAVPHQPPTVTNNYLSTINNRQHPFYRGREASAHLSALRDVLRAYACYNPPLGYCQVQTVSFEFACGG